MYRRLDEERKVERLDRVLMKEARRKIEKEVGGGRMLVKVERKVVGEATMTHRVWC